MSFNSSTSPFGPAPEGIDLSADQTAMIVGSLVSVGTLATAAVGLRIRARLMTGGSGIKEDDIFIFGALIMSWGTAVNAFVGIPHGLGKHIWALSASDVEFLFQDLFSANFVYSTAGALTKISILLFYRRLFFLQKLIYIGMFITVGWWLSTIITVVAACQPLSYFWTMYIDPTSGGSCIDLSTFFLCNAITNMAIDIFILLTPIPTIYKLRMSLRQKLTVTGILTLGGFTVVASIVRITKIQDFNNAEDVTWAMADSFIWSSVEPFMGTLSACLATLAPLVRRWWGHIRTRRPTGSSDVHRQPPESKFAHPEAHLRSWRSKIARSWVGLRDETEVRADDEINLATIAMGTRSLNDSSSHVEDAQDASHTGIMVRTEFDWSAKHAG